MKFNFLENICKSVRRPHWPGALRQLAQLAIVTPLAVEPHLTTRSSADADKPGRWVLSSVKVTMVPFDMLGMVSYIGVL